MTYPEFTTDEILNEQWNPVVGHEGLYEVSNLGRIKRVKAERSTHAGRILKPTYNTKGYARANLYWSFRNKRTTYFHIIVMEAFAGARPDGCDINHIDADKSNNRLVNLEYVTRQENIQHAKRLGLFISGDAHYARRNPEKMSIRTKEWYKAHPESIRRGSQNPMAKLNEEQVAEIKRRLAAGEKRQPIARDYGINPTIISMIKTGKIWKHVAG